MNPENISGNPNPVSAECDNNKYDKLSPEIKSVIEKIAGEANVYYDEPMKKHTTFRIGGPAECFVTVGDRDTLKEIISFTRKNGIPVFLLGNGSNILVSDTGVKGLIIALSGEFNEVRTDGEFLYAGAGATMARMASEALNSGLTGLEFAAGIPGTLGGGMIMNAGAYGGEFKDVTESVDVIGPDGEIATLSNEEMRFGYRTSFIKNKDYIVIGAKIKLTKGNPEEIKALMADLAERRRSKQPLEYPSAGSTFKRPEGYFAGKLISDSGLGGFAVGDAEVSVKHNGFVINKGNASAADVKELIDKVRAKVLEDSGVELEPEVIFLGEF